MISLAGLYDCTIQNSTKGHMTRSSVHVLTSCVFFARVGHCNLGHVCVNVHGTYESRRADQRQDCA
jgi:hypothetical protein